MKEIEYEVDKGSRDIFVTKEPTDSCIVNYAAVLQLEVEDIPKLQKYVRRLPNAKILYQTKSAGRLTIVRE